jgi:hypothetical protein
MVPPWQKYPHIPLGSLGWRMGAGEDYWFEFDEWFKRKTLHQRSVYAAGNPEPEGWAGFYKRKGVL